MAACCFPYLEEHQWQQKQTHRATSHNSIPKLFYQLLATEELSENTARKKRSSRKARWLTRSSTSNRARSNSASYPKKGKRRSLRSWAQVTLSARDVWLDSPCALLPLPPRPTAPSFAWIRPQLSERCTTIPGLQRCSSPTCLRAIFGLKKT